MMRRLALNGLTIKSEQKNKTIFHSLPQYVSSLLYSNFAMGYITLQYSKNFIRPLSISLENIRKTQALFSGGTKRDFYNAF